MPTQLTGTVHGKDVVLDCRERRLRNDRATRCLDMDGTYDKQSDLFQVADSFDIPRIIARPEIPVEPIFVDSIYRP